MMRSVLRLKTATVLLALGVAAGCAGGPAARKDAGSTSDPAYKVRLAQSLFNGGRVSEAFQQLDEAIAQEPKNPSLHHFRGQLYFRAARYAEAERDFKRALELDPYLSDAHNFLGAVYQEQGRIDEAEASFRRALENPAYPTPDKTFLNLGLLYALSGRDAEAMESMRKAVEINPKYYQAHFELASLLDKGGRLAEAVREYEVAEPGYRNSGEYYYRLGLTQFRLGDHRRARDNLSRVLTVAPGSESAAQAERMLGLMD